MLTLHTTSRLGLTLIAALAGCVEDGAFDPLSKPMMAVSSYRNRSLLNKTLMVGSGTCAQPTTGNAITIFPPAAESSCAFSFSPISVPDYVGSFRIRGGISSEEANGTFSVSFSIGINDPLNLLFNAVTTSQVKSIKEFSFLAPENIKLKNNTTIYLSVLSKNTSKPLTITQLSVELDVPTPTEEKF